MAPLAQVGQQRAQVLLAPALGRRPHHLGREIAEAQRRSCLRADLEDQRERLVVLIPAEEELDERPATSTIVGRAILPEERLGRLRSVTLPPLLRDVLAPLRVPEATRLLLPARRLLAAPRVPQQPGQRATLVGRPLGAQSLPDLFDLPRAPLTFEKRDERATAAAVTAVAHLAVEGDRFVRSAALLEE